MFKKQTVLDRTDLPTHVKEWVYEAYHENIYGNESFIKVYPYEILEWIDDENEPNPLHERRVLAWEECVGIFDRATYDFLKWCVEQGQREEFILLYWW